MMMTIDSKVSIKIGEWRRRLLGLDDDHEDEDECSSFFFFSS